MSVGKFQKRQTNRERDVEIQSLTEEVAMVMAEYPLHLVYPWTFAYFHVTFYIVDTETVESGF